MLKFNFLVNYVWLGLSLSRTLSKNARS